MNVIITPRKNAKPGKTKGVPATHGWLNAANMRQDWMTF